MKYLDQFIFIFMLSVLSRDCFSDDLSDNSVINTNSYDLNYLSNDSDNVFKNYTVYKKCCPLHQGLSRIKTSNQSSLYYECVDAIDENKNITFNTTLKYPLASMKIMNPQSKTIIGFPMGCDVEEYTESQLVSISTVASDSCMDRIFAEITPHSDDVGDGSLVTLSCKTNLRLGFMNLPKFRPISKCCVGDMIFDTDKNVCAYTNSSESNDFFSNLLNLLPSDFDIIDLKYGLPPCDSPKFMLHYTSKTYKFKFHGNSLSLKKNSKQILLDRGTFCVDQNQDGELVARSCRNNCDDGICITKCCPEGQVYMYANNRCGSRAVCGINPEWGFSPIYYNITDIENPFTTNPPDVQGIRYRDTCPMGKYILNPSNPKDMGFVNVETGRIVLPEMPNPFGHDFCIEVVDSPCPNRVKTAYYFVCFPVPTEAKESSAVKMKVFSIGFVISCAFLAATFLVYFFLPPLQNLHGRIIMCYVGAMLVAYSCLARVQWHVTPDSLQCKALGYSVYFSFMVAFSWLNVMCFDIWLTFGNIRSIQVTKQTMKELKKLFLFSLYAFGFPLILATVVFIMDEYDFMDGILNANIGKSQCWFNTGIHKKPFLLLFILPAGIQVASNITLFTLTAIHCNKVKSEIHRMQASSMGEKCKRRFMADKAMFAMNMKLFIVMGVTWTMEIVSAIYSDIEELWYITDSINCLQGVPIFCILVLKSKVYRLLKKRLGFDVKLRGRNDTSGVTSSTGISRTSCSEVMAKKHKSIDSSKIALTNGKSNNM